MAITPKFAELMTKRRMVAAAGKLFRSPLGDQGGAGNEVADYAGYPE
jgi:hypothetical protein